MEEIATYRQIYKYDPTRTISLRNYFARDMKRRFNELITVLKKSIITNDCFGLHPISIFQMIPASQNSMAYKDSSEKLALFALWLQDQIDRGIINIGTFNIVGTGIQNAWMNPYIRDAYERGVIRARQELRKVVKEIPTIDESGGIRITMQNPKHNDLIALLYIRIVNELKGLTESMKASILYILAQGITAGDSAEVLAEKLSAIVPLARAEMIARTAIIMAFAEGQLTEFENWGIKEVSLLIEWQTVGDEKVCLRCAKHEGEVFTIAEARGKIPLHPNCRCSWSIIS
jgi:SPP1 gp7 family putative phage head morphogenesis protein